ncbi:MAG: flagellar hook-length control protein FliK [Desulfosarcina sp.]|nr:flagellar hook-length control protein FliK [Desulfobacterales bacterium]
MQTDMLIFKDPEKVFSEVTGNKKNIKDLEISSDLAEEDGGFLSAFTGLLNEQINNDPAALNVIKQQNENSKFLQEEVVKEELGDSVSNTTHLFNESGFSPDSCLASLETLLTEQTETANVSANKTEFSVKDNVNLIGDSKKISGEFAGKLNEPESEDKPEDKPEDKIGAIKTLKPANTKNLNSDFLIAKADVQETNIPIAKTDIQDVDIVKQDNKSQINTIVPDTIRKANVNSMNNASELLNLKSGSQISPKETILPSAHAQPEERQAKSDLVQSVHIQSEAGSETVKKDVAGHEQNIKKHDLLFFQKKEIPFTGFDKSFDGNSGNREKFNKKEFFGKAELKALPQNKFNKASLHTLEGGAANLASETSSKIDAPVFTTTEYFKNKDLNSSNLQMPGEKIESGHIFPKISFSEQSATTVKADIPLQKPAAAEVLPQIIDNALLTLRKGQSEMRISLKPESLGRINLKIVTDNHHVLVKIIAENPHVKELIENNLHHLKSELGTHGLAIDKFDVFMAGDFNRNSGKEGNNEFFKMKNRKYSGGDSGQTPTDELEAPASLVEQDNGSNLVGVFA